MDIMTKLRQQHSTEQRVRKIQDADRILAEGGDVAAVVRELNVWPTVVNQNHGLFHRFSSGQE
jgi:cyanophycinase-like exopeptidase